MPYIGNDLATQFQAFATQTITGDGSTSYTLDRAVANGKELLVYINNVKQEEGSGKSYEASGTTITFSEAVASTDSCYLVYMGSAQQTVTAPDGSIVSSQFSSADLSLTGKLGIGTTSPQSNLHVTDTIKVATGNSQGILGLGEGNGTTVNVGIWRGAANAPTSDGNYLNLGGYDGIVFATGNAAIGSQTEHMRIDVNGHVTKPLQPAFLAHNSASQSNLAVGTNIDVTFAEEIYDTNSDFDTSNGRFTAPVTGKYILTTAVRVDTIDTGANYYQLMIKTSNRNYEIIYDPRQLAADREYNTFQLAAVADLDASDTAYIQVAQVGGSQQAGLVDDNSRTFYSGVLVA